MGDPPLPPEGEPQKFWMPFETTTGPWECSVKGCRGQAEMRVAIRVHFFHIHGRNTVVIY